MAPSVMATFQPQIRDTGDEDRGPAYRAFLIVMTVIVVLALATRFWSRSLMTTEGRISRFWADDWLALAALPFALASFALCFSMLNFGLGHHLASNDPTDLVPFMTILFAVYFVYDTTLVLLKASALFFFARVFMFAGHRSPWWFTWGLYTTHVLNICWFLGIVFASVFMCDPIAKSWNPMLEGHCGSTPGLWLGSAIPSVIIDFIILILPLPMIWRLQMSTTLKSLTTAIFVCGYCVIIVSIGRLITVIKEEAQLEADITWGGVPVLYWLCSEVTITMVSICLPATFHLGRRVAVRYFSPLASKISSIFSSNSTTGTGGHSRSYQTGSKMHTRKDSAGASNNKGFVGIRDDESRVSMESSRHILHPLGASARAASDGSAHGGYDIEDRYIYVDHNVDVTRHGALR